MTNPAPTTVTAGQPGTRWHDLTALASHEQQLLTAAIESLFTAPHLDAQISLALNYPAWPQPLTTLPVAAPDLTTATPQLRAYLDFVPDATGHAITLIDRHGWPDPTAGPAASDAAWLLLQHADHRNDDRRALLPQLAAAVSRSEADPRHLALLTDREHTVSGQPQRYATLRLIRDEQPVLLYPTIQTNAAIDHDRTRIGLPSLAEDALYAYSPLNPYGAARSCPTNPWRPNSPTAVRPNSLPAPPVGHLPLQPDGTVGVYLAATLRYRNQTRRVRDQLPAPLTSTSRWLDLDPLTRASCQLDAGLALNQLAARLCLADITSSDLLIAFADHRRSHGIGVELGAGLAHGKPIILIGPPRCSFDMLPDVTLVTSLDEALTVATRLAKHLMREPA